MTWLQFFAIVGVLAVGLLLTLAAIRWLEKRRGR